MNSLTNSSKEYSKVCTQIYVHLRNSGLSRKNALKSCSVHNFIRNYDGTKVVTDKERQTWILNKSISNELKDWPVRSNLMKGILENRKAKTTKRKLLKTNQYKRKTKARKLNKQEYYKYLETTQWKTISRMVVKRDNNKCTKCGSTHILQAHHTNYKNIFNETEHLEDLVTLCKECHTQIHSKK